MALLADDHLGASCHLFQLLLPFEVFFTALARLGATAVQIGYRSKPGEIAYILSNAEPMATIVHAEFLAAMLQGMCREMLAREPRRTRLPAESRYSAECAG